MNQAKIITVNGQEQLVLNCDFIYENDRAFVQKGCFVLTNINGVFGVVINVSNDDQNNPCAYINGQQRNTLTLTETFFDPKHYGINVGDSLRVMLLNEIDSSYFNDLKTFFQSRLDYYEKDLENQNGKVSYDTFASDWNKNNPLLTVDDYCNGQNLIARGRPRQVIKDILLIIE